MIDNLNDVSPEAWAAIEADFADDHAARALAAGAMPPAGEDMVEETPEHPATVMRRALAGEATPAQLLAALNRDSSAPVSFGAMAIARALLARQAMASSLTARAASTTTRDLVRHIGDHVLQVIDEDDALFLIIEVAARDVEAPPRTLSIIGATHDAVTLPLSAPVEGKIQFGIGRHDPLHQRLYALLRAPDTELYLSVES
ncbi:MAG: hypothetical protein AAFR04_09410 [Pseudomonadota bacterium]